MARTEDHRRGLAPVRQLHPSSALLVGGVLEELLAELGARDRVVVCDRGESVRAVCLACGRIAYARRSLRPELRCWPCGARVDVLDELERRGLDVHSMIAALDPRGEAA